MQIKVYNFVFAVVTQEYVTDTHNVYVIRGNSALLKCEIPSFVADFISVVGWTDNQGGQFFAATHSQGKTAKKRRVKSLLTLPLFFAKL